MRDRIFGAHFPGARKSHLWRPPGRVARCTSALARDPGHVCWYARKLARFYGAALDSATADAEKDILGVFKEGHCKRHAIALVAAAAAASSRSG